ncbi:hypothetical protein BDQ17DRAFT_328985 [Cyathus striatus]|nr:hypothetical protein BDQ17DRAFT_328985 [Cyathus striatus]
MLAHLSAAPTESSYTLHCLAHTVHTALLLKIASSLSPLSLMIVSLNTQKDGEPTESKITEEQPPPYNLGIRESHTIASSSLSPSPSVNQVHLISKNADITGTFYIDPKTPSLDVSRKRGRKSRNKTQPNASFQTRHGKINIRLGTTGNSGSKEKVAVLVSSRSGNITIDMLSLPAQGPRIALEANSRRGNLLVFFPENFTGVIQLLTSRGDLTVLPAMAKRISTLKDNGKEMIVVTENVQTISHAESVEKDLCQLHTHNAKIIIGLSGVDTYAHKVSFWKKMTGSL